VIDAVAIAGIVTSSRTGTFVPWRLRPLEKSSIVGNARIRPGYLAYDGVCIGLVRMDALPMIAVLAAELFRIGRHDRAKACATW
jgi:hypothetical protein